MFIPTHVLEETENAFSGSSELENDEELQSPVTEEDKNHAIQMASRQPLGGYQIPNNYNPHLSLFRPQFQFLRASFKRTDTS